MELVRAGEGTKVWETLKYLWRLCNELAWRRPTETQPGRAGPKYFNKIIRTQEASKWF